MEDSSQCSPNVPKRKSSWVWEYCTPKYKKMLANGEEMDHTRCKFCNFEMKADGRKCGTTGIQNHFTKKCEKSPHYKYAKSGGGQAVLSQESMGGNLVPHTFNQKKCDLKCVEFIIRDEMPFRAVEGSGFIAFLKELQPRYKVPDRKKVARGLWEVYEMEKAKIMSMIVNQTVSITTDTWTSIQNINYMVVTCHFLDNDWMLHKRIINFTKIISHKGEDIGKLLEMCLNLWGIEKVFTITVDNASANDSAVDFMKRRLTTKNNLILNGKYFHLRCACHIINLIVKDGLRDLVHSIEGIRNCVKFIHSSPSRLDKFREFAILEKFDPMSTVPMDVSTRWNSTYSMLESAYKFRAVFSRMGEYDVSFVSYFNEMEKVKKRKRGVDNSDMVKRVGPPSDNDWIESKAFVHFLKKFYDTTVKLSATKTTTSDIVSKEVFSIQREILAKKNDGSDLVLQSVAVSMLAKFEKYWGSYDKVNKLVFVANILDPRFKLSRIPKSFRSVGVSSVETQAIIVDIKSCLHDLYMFYYKEEGEAVSSSTHQANDNDIHEQNHDDDIHEQNHDDYMEDRELRQERRESNTFEITNEVDRYYADPYESLDDINFKLLDW